MLKESDRQKDVSQKDSREGDLYNPRRAFTPIGFSPEHTLLERTVIEWTGDKTRELSKRIPSYLRMRVPLLRKKSIKDN